MINITQAIYNETAEKGFLGSILYAPESIYESKIRSEHFYVEKNQVVYDAMSELLDNSKKINALNVIDSIGEELSDYVRELAGSVYTNTKFKDYQEIIIKDFKYRTLKKISEMITTECESRSPLTSIDQMISSMMDVETGGVEGYGLMETAVEILSRVGDGELPIISPYHYPSYDNFFKGYKAGQLVIIGCRPSVGKSTMLLNLCIRAVLGGNKTAFFSTEMTKDEIGLRFISNQSKVTQWSIEDGNEKSFDKAMDAIAKIQLEKDCTIYDRFGDFASLTNLIRKEASMGTKIVYIDYLQQIHNNSKFTLKAHITGEMSTKLKMLAQELKISILCAAQLNRDGHGEPKLHHLKESGDIEQDADIVVLLHDNSMEGTERNSIMNIVAKNRGGQKGDFTLPVDFRYYQIGDYMDVDTFKKPIEVRGVQESDSDF